MAEATFLTAMGMAAGKVIIRKTTESLLSNKGHLYTWYRSKLTKIKNQDVRFSISYLIRIKIPDSSKFLLVRGHRIKDQLQPVGGVYKKYHGFSDFAKWGYKEDCAAKGIKVDEDSSNDLRFRIKGKHVLDVIKWFESEKDRETSADREFKEELIETKILDAQLFNQNQFSKVSKVMRAFNYTTHFKCYEVLIYDIFELIPTADQTKALKSLLSLPRKIGDDFILVDISEIEMLKVMENDDQIAKIGEHTKYLINEK